MQKLLPYFFTFFIVALLSTLLFGSEPAESFPRLTNEQFAKKIKDKKNCVLVDVRTPNEFKAGHISGAININVKDSADFASKIAKLDKKKIIALYCKGGIRSNMAAHKLLADNYKVVDLAKGIDNWNGETVKEED